MAEQDLLSSSHLKKLEAQSIYVIREVAAELEQPALLFSGGKDSAVMAHLAKRAFYPAAIPFPALHVDTGHNFPEVIEFRDKFLKGLGMRLVVVSLPELIESGRVVEPEGATTRNRLQGQALVDAVGEHGFDALFGGGRRDEDKARAKERVFSLRDEFGQWDPRDQRPELWSLHNTTVSNGQNLRVFPLSDWTEADIWQYIDEYEVELPALYYAHQRWCSSATACSSPKAPSSKWPTAKRPSSATVRFRTVGDMTCTGAVESTAGSPKRSSPNWWTPGSANAARPAPTTSSPSRRWRIASVRGTSDAGDSCSRFATAGSVDDGKSTLIGRLLYDTESIFDDQIEAVEKASEPRGDDYVNLALLTDGLRAEREQGITIDVAYRYFATPAAQVHHRRHPGHVQYTRNMVTGASTADLALILVDARNGLPSRPAGTRSWSPSSAFRTW